MTNDGLRTMITGLCACNFAANIMISMTTKTEKEMSFFI